jgi:predicted glycoside hydrolase/deacetylase ChbG (UPF0249 family)
MTSNPRRIWLCADDYGAAPGVSGAIRELIARGRINATSIMVAAPNFNSEEAAALAKLTCARSAPRLIACHADQAAAAVERKFCAAAPGLFRRSTLCCGWQLLGGYNRSPSPMKSRRTKKFIVFGRTPDFLDGHQHPAVSRRCATPSEGRCRARAYGMGQAADACAADAGCGTTRRWCSTS